MKGKTEFSAEEIVEIRRLISDLSTAERYVQKKIRTELRNNCRFFISDFTRSTKGFKEVNFDKLICDKKISIYVLHDELFIDKV